MNNRVLPSAIKSVKQTIDAINLQWGGFPNCTTEGTYCYFTQGIQLNKVSPRDIDVLKHAQFGQLTTIQAQKKITTVAEHEYTHWVDMNCSIYGLRTLINLAKSYDSNPNINLRASEHNFFYAKLAADSIRQIRLPSYYSVTEKVDIRGSWTYDLTMGHGFDATGRPNGDPIIFLRFFDGDKMFFTRQPLSLSSILEGNATYQEILATLNANLSIEEDGERIVESKTDEQRLMENLYDKNLTLYSVAAHLIASQLKAPNVVTAYRAVGIIAKFVMNCPKSLLSKFEATQIFVRVFGASVATRIENSIRRGNVESLFFYAVKMMDIQSEKLEYVEVINFMLAERCFGITLKELQSAIDSEVDQLCGAIWDTKFPDARKIACAAAYNNKYITMFSNAAYKLDDLHLPPCFLENDDVYIYSGKSDNPLKSLPIADRFWTLADNEQWIRTFSEACYPRHEIYD